MRLDDVAAEDVREIEHVGLHHWLATNASAAERADAAIRVPFPRLVRDMLPFVDHASRTFLENSILVGDVLLRAPLREHLALFETMCAAPGDVALVRYSRANPAAMTSAAPENASGQAQAELKAKIVDKSQTPRGRGYSDRSLVATSLASARAVPRGRMDSRELLHEAGPSRGATPAPQGRWLSGVAKALAIALCVGFGALVLLLGVVMVGFIRAEAAATGLCERMQPGATEAEFLAAIEADERLQLVAAEGAVHASWPEPARGIAAISGQMTAINECAGFFDENGVLLGTIFTTVD